MDQELQDCCARYTKDVNLKSDDVLALGEMCHVVAQVIQSKGSLWNLQCVVVQILSILKMLSQIPSLSKNLQTQVSDTIGLACQSFDKEFQSAPVESMCDKLFMASLVKLLSEMKRKVYCAE